MAELERGLWRLSSPAPMLRQGQLEQVAQDCVWLDFEQIIKYLCFSVLLSVQ